MLSLRLLPRLALLVGVGSLLWAPGCGKQGEGERCDRRRNNDDDCESGLICVDADELLDQSQNRADRCCPPEGQPISDDRCQRNSGTGGTGGGSNDAGNDSSSGGQSGASGAAGSGGSSGGGGASGGGGTAGGGGSGGSGTTCTHSSECPGTQICGPTGKCQDECLDDGPSKDCPQGYICNPATKTCVLPDAGGD